MSEREPSEQFDTMMQRMAIEPQPLASLDGAPPPGGKAVATAEDDDFGPLVAHLERCTPAGLRALAQRFRECFR